MTLLEELAGINLGLEVPAGRIAPVPRIEPLTLSQLLEKRRSYLRDQIGDIDAALDALSACPDVERVLNGLRIVKSYG